jgi:hypothetical protein
MMAYALPTMSLGDWFRRLFSSAPAAEADEDAAALREEYGEPGPDAGEADLKRMEVARGGPMPNVAAAEGAEAAEAEIESEEAPPDLDP